jgi:hypothetical protein
MLQLSVAGTRREKIFKKWILLLKNGHNGHNVVTLLIEVLNEIQRS